MTVNPCFNRVLRVALFWLSTGFSGVCISQDAPPEKPESEMNRIYPRHKDIVIEQSDEEKKNTDENVFGYFPPGTLTFYVFESVEGDYYLIKFPIPGRLKKSDFYTSKEFKALDTNKILGSKDDWLKLVISEYYYEQDQDSEALNILNNIDSEFKNSLEFRALRARIKSRLTYFESALLDLAPILNGKRGERKARPSDVRLIKAYCLLHLKRHKEALEELDTFMNEIGGVTSQWIYIHALCHYAMGNYEKALENLAPEQLALPDDKLDFLYWLKSRCLILKERPEFDAALKKLDSEEILKSDWWGTKAALDAAFIHSARIDLAKRNGKRALAIIESLNTREDYKYIIKDATIAEAMAHLETGNYDKADRCMETLKTMHATEEEFPYLKQLEKAIRLKHKFVPMGRTPLVREKHL